VEGGRSARKVDLTAISDLTVWDMCEPRRLIAPWASLFSRDKSKAKVSIQEDENELREVEYGKGEL
jgi:hypothetical protein